MLADAATIEAADRAARIWVAEEKELPLGSDAHKAAVCRMFHETFNPYKPSVIDWPKLDDETRLRIINLPIWDIAVQTEGKARLRMLSYARSCLDQDMNKTIALNGWEEGRHKEVLSNLVEAYGIKLEPEPPYIEPRDPEWAYLVTGYSECVDSFFAFGLFEMARRSGFFPAELVETFEPVMQDECRHILLFANWVAWRRANLPLWRRIAFDLRVAAVWAFLGWERFGTARTLDARGHGLREQNNFTVTAAGSISATKPDLRGLLTLCLQENERRFEGYDARLVRPRTMPRLARMILRLLPRSRPAL